MLGVLMLIVLVADAPPRRRECPVGNLWRCVKAEEVHDFAKASCDEVVGKTLQFVSRRSKS